LSSVIVQLRASLAERDVLPGEMLQLGAELSEATATFARESDQPFVVPLGWVRPRRLLATLDSAAAAFALLLALFLMPARIASANARLSHLLLMTALGLLALFLMLRDGQYSSERRMSRFTDTLAVGRNLGIAFLLSAGLALATKGVFTGFVNYSRLMVFGYLAITGLLMVAARWGLWRYQSSLFKKGEHLRKVAVIGDGEAAEEFAHFLEVRPWLGLSCAGRFSFGRGEQDRGVASSLSEVTAEEVKRVIDACGAEEVVLALDPGAEGMLPQLTSALQAARVPFRIVPSLFEGSYRSAKLAGFHELPVVDMAVDPLDRVERTFKRTLDLFVAIAALLLLLPALLLIALLIKLTSSGPVLFRQERVGRNGAHFTLYKFRTMYREAEERLAELMGANEAEGHIFKIKDDPRITPVGRFLRRTSLDEFPQFFNVLKGEMSVVGPRPPIPAEVLCYETQHHCRLKGLPGITGLWQVSGRSELSFDEMVKLDRYYLENWSLALDLSIMLKTVYVVLARKGAY